MYKGEVIVKALQAILQDNLPDALDAVETEWDDPDPLALPDVVTWLLGHSPTVLERPQADFPLVACLVPIREPKEKSSQWGFGKSRYTLYVDCFVVAATEPDVNRLCWRFCEAIVSVTQNNEELAAGIIQQDYEPVVTLSEAMRQYEDNRNVEFFTQMGRVTLQVEA